MGGDIVWVGIVTPGMAILFFSNELRRCYPSILKRVAWLTVLTQEVDGWRSATEISDAVRTHLTSIGF